jgi:hypothetical protein
MSPATLQKKLLLYRSGTFKRDLDTVRSIGTCGRADVMAGLLTPPKRRAVELFVEQLWRVHQIVT